MKKNTLFFLPMFFLILSSCNGGGNSGPARQPLSKPVITVNAQKNGLTWEAVEGAVSYNVTVNSGEAQSVTTPGYSFSSEEGSYTVSVVAVADDVKYNSEAASYAYSTSETQVGELSAEGAVITIASMMGLGLEVKLNEGAYTDVQGLTYTAKESGTYTFHAKAGYLEETKVFYVEGSKSARQIEIDLRAPLAAPELVVNSDLDGLVWDGVEGAVSYEIVVNDGDPVLVTEPGYKFNGEEGKYTVSIKAKADFAKYDSEPAVFEYETKKTSLAELSVKDGVISWDGSLAHHIEYSYNGGEYVAIASSEESLAVTNNGLYTLKAVDGYDSDDGIYYAEGTGTIQRTVLVSKTPENALVLENGSEESSLDFPDKYFVTMFDGGWKESKNAYIRLSSLNKGYTEGNSAIVKFFKNGSAFRYNQNITAPGAFDTLQFTVKGDGGNANAALSVGFQVSKDVEIQGIKLNGVFMYYKISELPQNWTSYSINLADAGWKINYANADRTFAEVQGVLKQAGVVVNTLGDLLPYFDVAYVQFKCSADANYSGTYAYFDDYQLVNTGNQSKSEELPLLLEDHYAIATDALEGRLDKGSDGWMLSLTTGAKLPVTVEEGANEVTITSTATGMDFVAKMNITSAGQKLELASVTGTVAAMFANAKAEAYYVVEDFESYESTTQLREAYYTDFYSGGSGSVIGGDGWSLPTSTDYLDVAKQAENIHGGAQGGRFKYNSSNQMRFTSVGLSDNTALPLPLGGTFSFWTKGVETRANVLKIRVFYSTVVTPATQSSNCVEYSATIPQGSDWHEVRIELRPAVHYYGFTILPIKGNGSGQYFFIDDICMYNGISPWGKPAEPEPEPEKVMVNDFQSYSETGVGIDTKNADPTKITGLRADFYCDYYNPYSSSGTSPVGGNNWFLMGSTDYLNLGNNQTTGNKSAQVKSINGDRNMRYISMGIAAKGLGYAASTPAIGTNLTKMSFSIKGGSVRDNKVKLFAYYQDSITSTTQGSNRSGGTLLTIPMNSAFTEYTIDLDPTKTYYGYAIIVNGVSGDSAKADYLYVDNICVW